MSKPNSQQDQDLDQQSTEQTDEKATTEPQQDVDTTDDNGSGKAKAGSRKKATTTGNAKAKSAAKKKKKSSSRGRKSDNAAGDNNDDDAGDDDADNQEADSTDATAAEPDEASASPAKGKKAAKKKKKSASRSRTKSKSEANDEEEDSSSSAEEASSADAEEESSSDSDQRGGGGDDGTPPNDSDSDLDSAHDSAEGSASSSSATLGGRRRGRGRVSKVALARKAEQPEAPAQAPVEPVEAQSVEAKQAQPPADGEAINRYGVASVYDVTTDRRRARYRDIQAGKISLDDEGEAGSPRRRRRGRRSEEVFEEPEEELAEDRTGLEEEEQDSSYDDGEDDEPQAESRGAETDEEEGEGRSRRRRSRRSRSRRRRSDREPRGEDADTATEADEEAESEALPETAEEEETSTTGSRRRGGRHRRGSRRSRTERISEDDSAPQQPQQQQQRRRDRGERDAKEELGKQKMLINSTEADEIRIALVAGSELIDYNIERPSSDVIGGVGNIFKGVVQNVEPGIQAAFVDIGLHKNGFLHISDVLPIYGDRWKQGGGQGKQLGEYDGNYVVRERTKQTDESPRIQDLLKKGQEVLVQVTKSQIGNKGPSLSTYLSIPGRFLVLMPNLDKRGVSRKIEDERVRRQLKRNVAELEIPEGMGFIARTAAAGHSKDDLEKDLEYLLKLWKVILKRIEDTKPPGLVFEESDLMIRTIRDSFSPEVGEIVVDDEASYREIVDFMHAFESSYVDRVVHYDDDMPLFYRYGIEREIEKLFDSRVPLKSGGFLIIEQTEALVSIDVNSGRFTSEKDSEQTALKINIEAAEEICRQLRLRDLGGLIINDFIDMRDFANRRKVEDAMREHLKYDKAKTKVCRMSPLGLIEMTRQRLKESHKVTSYDTCPHCNGTGYIKSLPSQTLLIMRKVKVALSKSDSVRVTVTGPLSVIQHMQNEARAEVHALEASTGKEIVLNGSPNLSVHEISVSFDTARGHTHRV